MTPSSEGKVEEIAERLLLLVTDKREALKKYGNHKGDEFMECFYKNIDGSNNGCVCGLSDIFTTNDGEKNQKEIK